MKRLNLTGLITLAMVWCCGTATFAALIGTELVRSDATDIVSIGVTMPGWDCGWGTESGPDLQTNEITPASTCPSNFGELLAWHQNIDLFSASNAIVLARRSLLASEIAVHKNSAAAELKRPVQSQATVKAIPAGLFLFGIAGWAVRHRRRT